MPDLLFDRELTGALGDELVQLGLRVEVLTPDELSRATTVRRGNARLSVPDTFAFGIAESRQWTLLTGDGILCELALAEQIEIHGVLWLIDQFADGNHVTFSRLHEGLNTLLAHPRCRLPVQEVRRRLAHYTEQIRQG
ncbi:MULTISPECIES: PIN domain-containing protein [Bradyrhizobium]|uniref:hypothetical protein n=1 Tax=Bradyrhizobium centrosematis TaxID=1300039 RepID=UPI0021691B80|nr:hypothetical protein [Bradyrhizobium centrosematis]MCS3764796.1 hypothetical protein [Bradyrhizobium centrosematis]MCS3776152.1 hypothetical protein [Bradyrhizobium centrosematis]